MKRRRTAGFGGGEGRELLSTPSAFPRDALGRHRVSSGRLGHGAAGAGPGAGARDLRAGTVRGIGDAGFSEELLESPMVGRMRESVTPEGIRILTETIPGVRSVSTGIWIRQGSAHESSDLGGASHLLEHMVFKGTATRGPREIALALERLGGSLDAFTSREHTSYQARVLAEHLPVAVDVLSELVLKPLLRERDLELERNVVLEEIATVEDTPDDLVFELHGEEVWEVHPYGRSILGTPESVGRMTAEDLRTLHRDRYLDGEVVVAAAGHLDHGHFVEMVRANLNGWQGGTSRPIPDAPGPGEYRERLFERDTAQTHITVGTRTPGRRASTRFPLVLLSSTFGGGMSSRLFQRIREELGLAYSVFSFQSFHSQGGHSGVYVGTRPEFADQAQEALLEEFQRLSRDGLPEAELREVKDQVKGQVMLSLESTSSRLYRLAGFALYDLPLLTLDELLATIEGVSLDQVNEAAAAYFTPDAQVVTRLGPS